jgi:hypothetical protein
VHTQFNISNEWLIGSVVPSIRTTALRTKSPKHAELFLKAVGAIDARDGGGDQGEAVGAPVGTFTMNFLVPAPPIPVAVQEQAAKRLPPPMTFDVQAVSVPAVTSR